MNRQKSEETTSNPVKGMEDRPPGGETMNNRNRIGREVEETLGILDHEASITASPDFLTGVRRRIRTGAPVRAPRAVFFLRRVVAPALLIFLVVLNIVTTVFILRIRKSDSEAKLQGLTALAKDYAAYQSDAYSNLK